MHYVSVMYDRYMLLQHAFEQYPDLETFVLDRDHSRTPIDTAEYINLICEDVYNLEIFSRILRYMGKYFPAKTFTGQGAVPQSNSLLVGSHSWSVVDFVYRFHHWIDQTAFQSLEGRVCLYNTYFPGKNELAFWVKSLGEITILPAVQPSSGPVKPDYGIRKQLAPIQLGDSGFERMLAEMVWEDIPITFVEGFPNPAKNRFAPGKPGAIVSANSWYWDEPFKQYAAEWAEQGVPLLGIQHGGNYGNLALCPLESFERSITRTFYTWGWQKNEPVGQYVAMPASKLMHNIERSKRTSGILLITNSVPRYLYRFQWLTNYDIPAYINWQFLFYQALRPELKTDLRVRAPIAEYGRKQIHQWNERFPDVDVELPMERPFYDSVGTARLVLVDHLSTSFVECLSADIPVILFWDPERNELTDAAKPAFEVLKEAGILYETPEAAAFKANEVYDNVDQWWHSPGVQNARERFCEQWGRTDPQAHEIWLKELLTWRKSGRKQP